MKLQLRIIAGFVASISVIVLGVALGVANAQQAVRQAQAVSRSVFEVLEESRNLIDEQKLTAACDILTARIAKGKLTEYELANLYQYLGFCHHSAGDTRKAIDAFSDVLNIPSIEVSMRKSNLYTLAQLLTVAERYTESLDRQNEWFELEPKPAPGSFIFYAQTLYQLARYKDMIEPIEAALVIAKDRNTQEKEEWYSLLSFAYFQQENYAKIRDINKLLISKWPKKRYWLYLANAYRELNDEERFFSSYESLYLQDLLDKESELVTMAQLYMQNDVPYKAGTLMEEELARGRIKRSGKNFRLISQAWTLAREDSRSVEPLKMAARLNDNGDLYIRLANTYLNLGQYEACIEAARAGFEKGGLKNPDYAEISIGMCFYNVQKYADAIRAFRRAAKVPRSAATANQWIRIADSEIKRNLAIDKAEGLANKQYQELIARRALAEQS